MTRHMTLVPEASPEFPHAWLRTAVVEGDAGSMVHVAGNAEDLPRVAAVMSAVADRRCFRQFVLDAGAHAERALDEFAITATLMRPDAVPAVPGDVEDLLRASGATVVVVHADDHASLCCALAAARLGISIVRIGRAPQSAPGRLIARLADVLLVHGVRDVDSAVLAEERITVIGNPLADLVQREARAALAAAAWRRYRVAPGAYALALITGRVPASEVASALIESAGGLPVLVEAPDDYEVPGTRVLAPTFRERLSLERTARVIVTDAPRVHEEATVLGVPCIALGATTAPLPDVHGLGSSWDRGAVTRAADALVANFACVRLAP